MTIPAKVAFAVRQCLEEAVANLIDHTPATAGEDIAVDSTGGARRWSPRWRIRTRVRPARSAGAGSPGQPGERGSGRLGNSSDPLFRQPYQL